MAQAGVILGWISIVFSALVLVYALTDRVPGLLTSVERSLVRR